MSAKPPLAKLINELLTAGIVQFPRRNNFS
jgi:hypothetical protein